MAASCRPFFVFLLVTIFTCRQTASDISGPQCCDSWTTDGWKRFRDLPSKAVEQRKPEECANAVAAFSLGPSRGSMRIHLRIPRSANTSVGLSGTEQTRVFRRHPRAAHAQLPAGQQTRLTWTPSSTHGHLGVSFCREHEQNSCYMLDVAGALDGRLGYQWRRHGYQEQGLQSWVPGRIDPVPEKTIQTEQRLEDGIWPNNGAQEVQVNLQRTASMALKMWLSGNEGAAMEFTLPDDLPYFAVTPFAPLGQINTATAAMAASQKAKLYSDAAINPLLMRGENLLQRPGNHIIVSWRPDDSQARLGFAMCRDPQQNQCYVLLLFGFNGRLGFAFKKHSFEEVGAAGWVAGRTDRLPAAVLQSENSVAAWPPGRPLGVVVDRSRPGSVQIWIEGGSAVSVPLPDSYSYFTVASLDDRGGTAVVEGVPSSAAVAPAPPHTPRPPSPSAIKKPVPTVRPPPRPAPPRPASPRPTTPRPTTPRPTPPKTTHHTTPQRPSTSAPRPPPNQSSIVLDTECVAAIRVSMVRGQQMLMVWEPRGTQGNFGVAFCVDKSQGDCYVLDVYGFKNRKLAYSWRHHSALEAGGGAWVPGSDSLMPEVPLQTETEVEPGWQGDTSKYLLMVSISAGGMMELRVDGLDPVQKRQLVFTLPEAYTSVTVSSAQNTGQYSIRGPCFNGLRYKWSAAMCSLSDAAELAVDYPDIASAWTLKARSAHGRMRSPAMSGTDGDICVSIEALALGSARLTLSVEDIDGRSQPVRLAEIIPQSASRGEWQRLQKTLSLPEAMRQGQVRLVVQGDNVVGSGLLLIKRIDFCNPNTCGVARSNVLPLIAYGHVAKVGDYPWYAGIYRQDGDSWESICGGTLVRADIVVSAAHCFYDESSWKTRDKNKFKVSVGKYVRDWDVQETGEQRSAVMDIVIPERYRGSKRIYEHDIAYLRVRFVVSTLVLPICVDFSGQYGLRAGDVGVVTGWGHTENQSPSTKLQYARMPYVSFDQCIRSVPDTLAKFITGDKFCAGNLNGSTVWPGDSGGGLAFLRSGRWFLRGIVSTGIPGRLTYSAFTDVNFYLDLLNKFFAP